MFALANANWPALLVDASGNIRAASQGAEDFFGEVITEHSTLEHSIWAKENSQRPEEFFAAYEELADPCHELKFKLPDGSIEVYRTHICTVQADSTDLYLLQIFETQSAEATMPAAPTAAKTTEGFTGHTVVDAGVAQKQKLDCAMQLIRTVTLDFNNALTSILGHVSLLLAKAEPQNPMRGSLVEIEKSAQRAGEIASDLAAFSRQEKDTKAHASGNVNEILRRTVEVFKGAQPETIHWKLDLQNRVYGAKFDEAKMQQAFIKILENAVQAMEGFGTVYISTRNLEISEPLKDGNARLVPGAYICVEISDTGKGITAEVLPRIFEPFFTTKKEIGHRGLGLAWVYGIVTNHAGSVAVKSEVGKGTSVRVYLPAQKKTVLEQTKDLGDLSGKETI
ncbi:MAG: two-component system sensor histidine kinase NtrB, partial [Limisphaerales bacterium]